MRRFANLTDGGARLVDSVRAAIDPAQAPILVAIIPNGVPVAEPIGDALDLPILGADIEREGDPRVVAVPEGAGKHVIVVDDGVETGTASRLVGMAMREAGASRLLLAVPVCPRQAEAELQHVYDGIIAVERPLARRDLRWHFDDFDTIDEAEARRRLDAR